MKLASTIACYLLGLMFTIFGLNGFLQFIRQPPPTNPLALESSSLSAHRTSLTSSSGCNLSEGFYFCLDTLCRSH